VSLRPVTWEGDAPTPIAWQPDEAHPLFRTFAAAIARTRKHEAEGLHHRYAKDLAPLALLAALPPEKGGDLVGAWARETNVVLPADLDRVVLLDTDDEPLPRLEVQLETLVEAFPHAFEPLACGETLEEGEALEVDDARLVRTRGVLFPTLSEKRFLVARQALRDAAPETTELRDVTGAPLSSSDGRKNFMRNTSALACAPCHSNSPSLLPKLLSGCCALTSACWNAASTSSCSPSRWLC